jgi:hypothetical protein
MSFGMTCCDQHDALRRCLKACQFPRLTGLRWTRSGHKTDRSDCPVFHEHRRKACEARVGVHRSRAARPPHALISSADWMGAEVDAGIASRRLGA